MFEALVPSIAFAWLGDAREAIVVASLGVAIYTTIVVVVRGRQFVRAGMNRSRSAVALFALGPTATLLFWANAFIFASLAVYALALCIQLSVAVVSFYTLVSAAQDDLRRFRIGGGWWIRMGFERNSPSSSTASGRT